MWKSIARPQIILSTGVGMDIEALTRRGVLLAGISSAAASAASWPSEPNPGTLHRVGSLRSPLAGSVVRAAAIVNDIMVNSFVPSRVDVIMQTNGIVLRLETSGIGGILDVSKICLEVSDNGFNASGDLSYQQRTIRGRDMLRGPTGGSLYYSPSPDILHIVLADRIFNQSSEWQTRITSIVLEEGWITGQPSLIIDGVDVERLDSQPYLPFPVKVATPPFQRAGFGEAIIEVSGINDFARDGSPFACVEAWAVIGDLVGNISRTAVMARSIETPGDPGPSASPAPVYTLRVATGNLPDGPGEISYQVKPWIGPPWISSEKGEVYPTANAPVGLPFVNDADGSYMPYYGFVNQDGSGSDGSILRGLSSSLEQAYASGIFYRDAAAVAKAVRTLNRTLTPELTADGAALRARPHDDIAGGVAVLTPVAGSKIGQNAGAYSLRTGFSASSTYPTGATCFEIRSLSGKPSDDVRLRGVLATGGSISASNKYTPARLILRGVILDGRGTTTSQNTVVDGTPTAGASTTRPSAALAAYLISIDTRYLENEAAGSTNPIRKNSGYLWDVRVEHQGVTGTGALAATANSHSAMVASVGSVYGRSARGAGLNPTCLLGLTSRNVPIVSQAAGIQPTFTGQLLMNVRVVFETAFTSPALQICTSRPTVGGIGVCNFFALGKVDSGGPLIQIGADGTRTEIDNAIIRHVGHFLLNSTVASNGRANLLYQDQGWVRVNKVASISYCAFICFTLKGDTFAAPEKAGFANTSNEGTWVRGKSYYKGAIVWDTAGPATPASCFYQAIADIGITGPESVELDDRSRWFVRGLVYGQPYGTQPRRQGNAAIRYHVNSRCNVYATTFNSYVPPSPLSGYGYALSKDETIRARIADYYFDPYSDDFRPMPGGVLANRVPVGLACVPFDLAGSPRRNDGTGAAGPYELMA